MLVRYQIAIQLIGIQFISYFISYTVRLIIPMHTPSQIAMSVSLKLVLVNTHVATLRVPLSAVVGLAMSSRMMEKPAKVYLNKIALLKLLHYAYILLLYT